MPYLVQKAHKVSGIVEYLHGLSPGAQAWTQQPHRAMRFASEQQARATAEQLPRGSDETLAVREERPEDRRSTLA